MMLKRRKRTDTSRESKMRQETMDYPMYRPRKLHIMTKKEFRERLMEDLNVSAI